jgi:DNA-binding NarL/FixJ family response regulator
LRILLADDNPAILDAVQEILPKDFIVVGALSSGQSVLQQTPVLVPDVVVLDISMPDMNGLEVARRLKQINSNAKIVFLSVHEAEDFVHAAFDLGASAYVFKSRLHIDLLPAIETVFQGKQFTPESSSHIWSHY